jgi:hypothetical protein
LRSRLASIERGEAFRVAQVRVGAALEQTADTGRPAVLRCNPESLTAPLLVDRIQSRRTQLVSYLGARWTLPSTASGQDVPGQKSDDDDGRRDRDDGDGGGGYDHAAILASCPASRPGG